MVLIFNLSQPMSLLPNQFYHVYNQGNNKGRIFFNKDNYHSFLQRYEKSIAPYCKTVAFCLMPNHFHFLLYTTDDSVQKKKVGGNMSFLLKEGYRQLLSSYTMAINPQEKRSGSLFRQRNEI